MTTMPKQKPGKSKQDYETPRVLLDACAALIGRPLAVDLACRDDNKKAPIGITEHATPTGSLGVQWAERFPDEVMWLNPPFGRIDVWAAKCAEEGAKLRRGAILFLVPASVGSNWFLDHVWPNALTRPLLPRVTFDGCTDPFPKDLIVAIFARTTSSTWRPTLLERLAMALGLYRPLRAGFEPWRWLPRAAELPARAPVGELEEAPKPRRKRKPRQLPIPGSEPTT